MTPVSIVVPTFRRPEMLDAALRSIHMQRYRDAVEVIVVDNDATASARSVFDDFLRDAGPPQSAIHYDYHVEATPGVSAARNTGVARTKYDVVVFLDDDQTAEPGWLQALVDAHQQADAAAVFGCTLAWTTDDAHEGKDLALALIHRDFGHALGPVRASDIARLGTGNSLFHKRWLHGNETFAARLGLTGGEDTELIHRIQQRGGALWYAPNAVCKEFVPQARTTMRFVLERRFSSGQLRTRSQLTGEGASWWKAGAWMAIGAAQTGVGLAGAALTALPARGRARAFLGTAAAGLGKVLFADALLLERYRR
jgi:succinoglycan biosynthesis protein ExoM